MPRCPFCEQEIDYLVSSYDIRRMNKLRYEKKSDLLRVTSEDEKLNTFMNIHYSCPLCGEKLFYTLDSVKKFLKEQFKEVL